MKRRLNPDLIALAAMLLFELAWVGWILVNDRTIDYYAYDVASSAIASGWSPYQLDQAATDRIAASRGINAVHAVPPYLYAPFLASLLQPLQLLPARAAAAVWSLASLAALLGSALLLAQLANRRWLDWRISLGLMLFVPVMTTFHAGQVNHFILFAMVAATLAIDRQRERVAGVALAFGILLKVIPLSIAAVIVLRRRWRLVGWLTGSAIALTALTIPWTGFALYLDYARQALQLAGAGTATSLSTNQSIGAAMVRIAGPDLGPPLGLLLSALVACSTLFVIVAANRRPAALLPSIGMIVAGVALAAPLSWIHHQVLLALPCTILWRAARGTADRRLALVVIVGGIVLLDLMALAWKTLQAWPWLSSLGTLAIASIWLALLRVVVRPSDGVAIDSARSSR